MSLHDLQIIEAALGMPRGTVTAVERRKRGDFVILLRRPRKGSAADLAWPKAILGRRALRISRRAVFGQTRSFRRRNRPINLWASRTLGWDCPAARLERLDRGDRMLDELRAAVARAAHAGEAQRWLREEKKRRAA